MKLVRKWDCAVCGGKVLYHSNSKEMKCDCGTVTRELTDMEMWNFIPYRGG